MSVDARTRFKTATRLIRGATLCALVAFPPAAAGKGAFAEQEEEVAEAEFLLPHLPDTSRFWLSGQLNVISQYHPPFPAAYSGPNSLAPHSEFATSFVATVYSGMRIGQTTEILLDLESAGGGGLSTSLGLAGATNLDVVRNPSLGAFPYVSRALVHHIIPLSDTWMEVHRGPFQFLHQLPERRIELRAGKFSTVDFFDVNGAGSDSHFQFMNWAVDNDGAYDYAADTRGYTLGVEVEYQDRIWAVRFGEMLMPTVANGIRYDFDVLHARGENLEFEFRPALLPGRYGAVRVLTYLNHAHMGSYREAIAAFEEGRDPLPDIQAHRHVGALKLGFGLNLEQEITGDLRLFARAGWNDGKNESFAYTEVDDSAEIGMDLWGTAWSRAKDKLGLAFVTNGLSAPHRTYLRLGGRGFILGDGALSYGRELIAEAYYTARAWRGIFPAADVQFIENPGYNRARGPVVVASLRLHLEL